MIDLAAIDTTDKEAIYKTVLEDNLDALTAIYKESAKELGLVSSPYGNGEKLADKQPQVSPPQSKVDNSSGLDPNLTTLANYNYKAGASP